jgi:hypothetical protein
MGFRRRQRWPSVGARASCDCLGTELSGSSSVHDSSVSVRGQLRHRRAERWNEHVQRAAKCLDKENLARPSSATATEAHL